MEPKYYIFYYYNKDDNFETIELVDEKNNIVLTKTASNYKEFEMIITSLKSQYNVVDTRKKGIYQAQNNTNTTTKTPQQSKYDEYDYDEEEDNNFLREFEQKSKTFPYVPFDRLKTVYGVFLTFTIIITIIEVIACLVVAVGVSTMVEESGLVFLLIFSLGTILTIVINLFLWYIFSSIFGLLYDVKAIRNILEKQNKNK